MDVKHSNRVGYTPAFAILAEGWNEVVQEGFSPEGQGVSPVEASDQVLYAERPDGEIVGVLTYREHESATRISFFYVEPTSRQKGVLKAMLQALKVRVPGLRIIADIEVANNYAIQALNKLGARVTTVACEIPGS